MMTLNPEIVKRAQVELDELTHGERTITLEDRSQLPYIDCIVKETYRYVSMRIAILLLRSYEFRTHPPGPLGRSKFEFDDRTSLTLNLLLCSLTPKAFPISPYERNSTESGQYLQARWFLPTCGRSPGIFQVSLMTY